MKEPNLTKNIKLNRVNKCLKYKEVKISFLYFLLELKNTSFPKLEKLQWTKKLLCMTLQIVILHTRNTLPELKQLVSSMTWSSFGKSKESNFSYKNFHPVHGPHSQVRLDIHAASHWFQKLKKLLLAPSGVTILSYIYNIQTKHSVSKPFLLEKPYQEEN
jgi:hypothetical protein